MSAEALPQPEVIGDTPARIEATALVYLDWDDTARKWVVSPETVDGAALDYDGAGVTSYAGPYSQLDDTDRERFDRAVEYGRMPTAVHLAHMILEAAGYEAHEVGDTYRRYLK